MPNCLLGCGCNKTTCNVYFWSYPYLNVPYCSRFILHREYLILKWYYHKNNRIENNMNENYGFLVPHLYRTGNVFLYRIGHKRYVLIYLRISNLTIYTDKNWTCRYNIFSSEMFNRWSHVLALEEHKLHPLDEKDQIDGLIYVDPELRKRSLYLVLVRSIWSNFNTFFILPPSHFTCPF